MPRYQATHSTHELLGKLGGEDLLRNREAASGFIRELHSRSDPPLYLRALIGVGAFIASLFLLAFLFVSELIQGEELLLFWGLGFIAAAFGLWKLSEKQGGESFLKTFLVVLSFTWMAVGKTLFVWWFVDGFDEYGAFIGLAVITSMTYFVYRLTIDRFLSCMGVSIALTMAVLEAGVPGFDGPGLEKILALCVLVVIQGLAAYCLLSGRTSEKFLPMAYALVGGLTLIVFCVNIFSLEDVREVAEHTGFSGVLALGVLLSLALIGLVIRAAGGRVAFRRPRIVGAMVVILLTGWFFPPGILLAVCLLVYGYGHHDRILAVFGGVILPVFLFHLYHDMELALSDKAAVLVGSGLVLLAARFIFCRGKAVSCD